MTRLADSACAIAFLFLPVLMSAQTSSQGDPQVELEKLAALVKQGAVGKVRVLHVHDSMLTRVAVSKDGLRSIATPAQDSAQYRACNEKAKAQTEMNACASDEAARIDAELNDVYRKLLSTAASPPESAAKIKAAERAWIAYRDAYMDAMYPAKNKQAEYGSIYPMEADLLRAKLTRRQVTALKELLQQYSGEGGMGEAVDPKDGSLHSHISVAASSKPSR